MDEDFEVPLLLEIPFLKTDRAIINVELSELIRIFQYDHVILICLWKCVIGLKTLNVIVLIYLKI